MIVPDEEQHQAALAAFDAEPFVRPSDAEMARYRAMTPGERVGVVWELTRAAWARTGAPWPRFPRAQMPVRTITLAEDR